ncbi:hypothetical protein ACP70R_007795 [Stipagrostis hirtigluma subsp. patula]
MVTNFYSVARKVLFIVVAMAAILFSAGYAWKAPTPPGMEPPPGSVYPGSSPKLFGVVSCHPLKTSLPDCSSMCDSYGMGGFIKGDQCCCEN